MRFLIAALFCIALFQFTACSGNSDQQQTTEPEPDKTETTAVTPSMGTRDIEEMDTQAPGETVEAISEPTTPPSSIQPKAVKTSEKRVINKAPKNQEPPVEKTPVKTGSDEKSVESDVVTSQSSAKEADKVEELVKEEQLQEEDPVQKPTPKVEAGPDHSKWDVLLKKYVSNTGKVNYAGLKSDQTKLQAYLDDLAANPVQDNWGRAEKMAYWINVYNAFTIKLIVDNYPLSSITNLHGGEPWDVKWIKLGNKTYSLNEVENDILRPKYKDARIHFAVNCAAKSCPPLLNSAWTGDNLNANLEKQTKAFINNSNYNAISAKKVNVSKIFEWYAADFGDLIEFLNKYSETSINNGATVNYKEYDWALNN